MSDPEIIPPGHVNNPSVRPYGLEEEIAKLEAGGFCDVRGMISALLRDGFTIVPVTPPVELLRSMAMRVDHGLFAPLAVGSPFEHRTPIERDREIEVAISDMGKAHEEVVGLGFYSDRFRARYSDAELGINPEPVRMEDLWKVLDEKRAAKSP